MDALPTVSDGFNGNKPGDGLRYWAGPVGLGIMI